MIASLVKARETMPEPETLSAAEYRKQHSPSEDDIHKDVITWARANEATMPALRMLFHPANGGNRNRKTGALMKALGQKKGVPDLILPVPNPRGPIPSLAHDGTPLDTFNGLALELKSPSGRVRPTQAWWLLKLRERGYATDVAYTFEEATRILSEYCRGEYVPDDLILPDPEQP